MARHLLTDVAVRKAKPKEKPYRLADGDGLYFYVAPTGGASWQLRYRLDGKPQTATLGKWPRLTLAAARLAAEEKRRLAANGEHLTVVKRVERIKRATDRANTFSAVAADWVKRETRRRKWSAAYREEVEASLRNHLSSLHRLPLSEITAPIAGPILRMIERRAPYMVEKVKPRLHAIMDYGVEMGIIPGNPLPITMMRGGSFERRHFPAVTALPQIGEILRTARTTEACKGVQRAHTLLVYTGQRIGEVLGATWAEMDLEAGNWTIPRARMKQHKDPDRGPHVVPLPPYLLAALREWRAADAPEATYICPAPRDPAKPITAEAVEKLYRRSLGLAGKHSPHSWRSAFSTVCREAGKDGDLIEAQLDHVVGNKVQSAYDRAKRLELRRELMAWYEATLIAARDGAAVLPIQKRVN
jgi:integrase